MQAVSEVSHIEFAKVKIGLDITMVIISFATCLIVLNGLGSVGLGTILSDILVEITLRILNKFFGNARKQLL